jgi:hypothetical protein
MEHIMSAKRKVRIGSRVHCILHGGRDGVIVTIHGQQTPESCRSIGGAIVTGGSAYCDIVWENGTQSLRIPETLIHSSSQWRILEGVATTAEIQSLCGLVILETQRKNDEQEERTRQFNAAVAELRANPAYSHLQQTSQDKYGSAALAASNIRAELKRAFPGIKFSVRSKTFSGGDSVDVSWTDGPTIAQVDKIADKYSAGSFDGMTDCYNYSSSAWTSVFGDAKYIHTARSHSVEAMKEAVREVCLEHGWELLKVETSSYDGRGYLPSDDHDRYRVVHDFLEKRNQYAQ